MAENVEVGFDVGISVCVVGSQALAGEMFIGGSVQAASEAVGLGIAPGGVAAPTAGIEPFSAVSGSVDVKGDQKHQVVPEFLTDSIDPAAALWEGDIIQLRNQEPGIEAQGNQVFLDMFCKETSIGVFAEETVRAPLARSVLAVAVVEKDCHSYRL